MHACSVCRESWIAVTRYFGGQKNTRIGRERYVHWLTCGHRRCRFGATSSPRLVHSPVGRSSLVAPLACTVASLHGAQGSTGGGGGADGAKAEATTTTTTKVVALGSAIVSAAMRMLFVRQLTVDVFSSIDVAYAGAYGKGRRRRVLLSFGVVTACTAALRVVGRKIKRCPSQTGVGSYWRRPSPRERVETIPHWGVYLVLQTVGSGTIIS